MSTTIDLAALSFVELVALRGKVDGLIAARRDEERTKFLAEHHAMMAALQLVSDPVTGCRPAGAATPGGEPIRFRGPNGEEWTGRGPKVPEWLRDLEAHGRNREEFRVSGRYRKR